MMIVAIATLWPTMAFTALLALIVFALRPPVPAVALRTLVFLSCGFAALSIQGAATTSGLDLWIVAAAVSLMAGAASMAIFTPGKTSKDRGLRFFGSLLVGGVASSGVITKYSMPHTDWVWVSGAGGFFGWALGAFGGYLAGKLENARSIKEAKAIFFPAPTTPKE